LLSRGTAEAAEAVMEAVEAAVMEAAEAAATWVADGPVAT